MYMCKACNHQEQSEPTCVQRYELGNTAGATAGSTADVINDPTVGAASDETSLLCALCGGGLTCVECGESSLGDLEAIDQDEACEDPES